MQIILGGPCWATLDSLCQETSLNSLQLRIKQMDIWLRHYRHPTTLYWNLAVSEIIENGKLYKLITSKGQDNPHENNPKPPWEHFPVNLIITELPFKKTAWSAELMRTLKISKISNQNIVLFTNGLVEQASELHLLILKTFTQNRVGYWMDAPVFKRNCIPLIKPSFMQPKK